MDDRVRCGCRPLRKHLIRSRCRTGDRGAWSWEWAIIAFATASWKITVWNQKNCGSYTLKASYISDGICAIRRYSLCGTFSPASNAKLRLLMKYKKSMAPSLCVKQSSMPYAIQFDSLMSFPSEGVLFPRNIIHSVATLLSLIWRALRKSLKSLARKAFKMPLANNAWTFLMQMSLLEAKNCRFHDILIKSEKKFNTFHWIKICWQKISISDVEQLAFETISDSILW